MKRAAIPPIPATTDNPTEQLKKFRQKSNIPKKEPIVPTRYFHTGKLIVL